MAILLRGPALIGAWLGCALVPAAVRGQNAVPRPTIIGGLVLDAAGQPMPGTTVRLVHLPDTLVVAGNQTNMTGHYDFSAVAPGRYQVRASAVGLTPAATAPFELTGRQASLTLPTLRLRAGAQQLKGVTVVGQQKAVEAEPGKLVYNLDQRVSAAGTSAFDVVQRLPGVSVTQDENLLLKGNGNVNVLLDGKRTYLSGNQLAALLKSMPAENLLRVEVLSVPGAQYDAAGSAGVLNLVTKKSAKPGYALHLSAGAGTGRYPQTTETAVGNVQSGKLNLFGSYGYHYKKSYLDRTSYRVLGDGPGLTSYDRASFDPSTESGHSYRVGLDFQPNARHTLGAAYTGTSNRWTRTGRGPTAVRNETTGLAYGVLNDNLTREPGRNHAYNLNYQARPDTAGRLITADADYAHYDFNALGSLGSQLTDPAGRPTQPYQQVLFSQPSVTTIRSLKADVVWPMAGWRLAGGMKYSAVRADNDFRYDSLQGGQYVFAAVLSNHFVYEEQIFAAYASGSRTLGKTTLDAGLRVESTHSVGNLLNRELVNRRRYTNLFPTLTLSRPLGAQHQLSLILSRRLNRPQYSDLNPARYFFDKFSYYEGNPFLQPEMAWKGAVAYTYKNDYVLTLSASRTSNALSSTGRQDPATGELVLSIDNFAHRDDFDAQFLVPLKLAAFWTVQNTVDFQYVSIRTRQGTQVFAPRKFTLDVATTHTLALPGGVGLELAAYYTSPSLAGINVFRTYFTVDAGLKKSFANPKIDVRLTGTDLLRTIHYWGYSVYEGANTSYNHRGDTRRVNLSVAYHLGGDLNGGRTRSLEEAGRVK